MSNTDRQAEAQRVVRRAIVHLGDACAALENADRMTGNHEFMTMANKVGQIIGWVEEIPTQAR